MDYYAQALTAVVIDGVSAVDFAEGNCISVESGGEQASLNKGADGAKTSLAFDATGKITVRLKPTSTTNDQIAGIVTQQQSGTFPDITVTVQAGSGETHTGVGGSIVNIAPVSTGGAAMEQREWVFQFETLTTDS